MSDQPYLSIVIPTMNRKEQTVATVDALLELGLGNIEIIVVDDGSTDGSENVDLRRPGHNINFIKHGRNRGGCAARNTGIDAASADLVALLDSDDRWLPAKIDRQLEAIKRHGRDRDFIAVGNVISRRGSDEHLHNKRGPDREEDISEYLMVERQALQTSTMLLPTNLAQRIRFRDGLKRHQDWDFILRVLADGADLLYDDEPLAIYDLDLQPGRVSLQPRRLAATLEWIKLAGNLISERAGRVYFVRAALSRDGLNEPRVALRGLAWLATRSPLAIVSLIATLAQVGIQKLAAR
ncbi:glycosyltransferase family 2 protein [Sphingomonas crocodyli]|uniref:Glycosyltransferase family 2 protein n=1 Tax=Sphingomonas crocodyli TaxID=1979270 RepID=A0A437LXR8_9SPHN|nr:glycosyltransferase family 2 protein [Sphingomonas crocodyli]RVT90209.1 glycosyltransferase family 2 protein [Sphingomonas crocodyli]